MMAAENKKVVGGAWTADSLAADAAQNKEEKIDHEAALRKAKELTGEAESEEESNHSKRSDDEEGDDYWNPERLHRHFLEAGSHPSRAVTVKSLMAAFEGMEEHDSEHVLELADEWWRGEKVRRDIGYEDMLRLVSRVDSNIREGLRKFTLMPKVTGADPNEASNVKNAMSAPFRDDNSRILAKVLWLKKNCGAGTTPFDSRIHDRSNPRYRDHMRKLHGDNWEKDSLEKYKPREAMKKAADKAR